MLVYIILASVVGLAALSETGNRTQKDQRWFGLCLLVFLMVVGLRYGHGDYSGYESAYYNRFDIGQDWGYYQAQLLFHSLGFSFQTFVFVISLFSVFALSKFFRISTLPAFGMAFVLGKCFTFYAMSGIRQYIAMVICWWAICELLMNKRKLLFLLMVFIGYLFHGSAIVVLPLFFLVDREFKISITILVLIIAAIIGVYWESFFQYIIGVSEMVDERFGNYLRDPEEVGMNLWNYAENFLFLFFAIIVRKEAVKKIPYYDFFLYVFVLYCAFFLVGQNVRVMKRVRDYFSVSYAYIVPAFIYLVQKGWPRKLVKFVFVFYFILLMFRSLYVYDSAFSPGTHNRMIPYHSIFQMEHVDLDIDE